jgi:SH3-like domain-containing protein
MPDSPPAPDASGPFRRALRAMLRVRRPQRLLSGLLLLAYLMPMGLMLAGPIPVRPAQAEENLPLPRYASFKSAEVNLRAGPGENYPKQWVYQRAGMPVEIFEEWDTWRRIRDYQGVVGWVSVNLLTSRRTAVVTETRRTLHDSPDATAPAVALLDPGVIGRIEECNGDWCRLEVKGYEGWLKRTDIWGVNATENFKE